MILKHLWARHQYNQENWQQADQESLIYCTAHIALIGLIPALCCYFSSVYLGWSIGNDTNSQLTHLDAAISSTFTYISMVTGVFILSFMAWRLAVYYGAVPSFSQTLEMSAYCATPVFMLGFCALYPEPWFLVVMTISAISYSGYLLYSGIQIIISLDQHLKRRYSWILISLAATVAIAILAVLVSLYRR